MFDYSSHACLPNFVNVARPNMYRAGTVRMDHSGTQTYKAKGSRVANHAWTPTMSVTFYKASVIGKSKKQLESCRTHAWHTMTTTNTITNSCSLSAQ